MSKKDISRRNFLKGAAASAISVAALSVLGGCSNDEQPCDATVVNNITWPACEDLEPKAAGVGTVAFVSEAIKDSEIIETHNVDVVVCGLGPAGYATAIACANEGLKTIVIEKGVCGTFRSPTMGGLDDRIHKKYGVEFDKKQWLDDAMTSCSFGGSMEIYQKWLDTHAQAVNWFLDLLECKEEDFKLTFAAGDFPDFLEPYDKTSLTRSWNSSINLPLSAADIVTQLNKKVIESGAELHFNTPAVQLIKDNDTIVGVIVKNEKGYVKYLTSKGVVLCTGGYEFNLEKLQRCCRPRDLALSGWMNGTPTNTGDGHEMGLAAGAMEDEYPHPLMLDPKQLMPYIRVNKTGKRFTPEYEPYNNLALAIQSQPGAYDYYLTDGDCANAMDKMWTPSSSCYGPKFIWIGAATSENALKADSLEALADLMNVPRDNFLATIKQWNEMCDKGEDTQYHYPSKMMHPIKVPPFYANKEGAEALCTAGGLQVSPDSEVLDKQAQAIKGLYAVGNVSGSMFKNTYSHNLNALSHSRCITFGYNVAKQLAGK